MAASLDDAYVCKMTIIPTRSKQAELGTGADRQDDAKEGQRVEGTMTIWSGEACLSKVSTAPMSTDPCSVLMADR